VLRTAAAVEQFSEHPVARAILSAYESPPPKAVDFESRRGQGASARLPDRGGERVLVGSPSYLGIDPGSTATAYADRGSTVVWVGRERAADGFIVLRDEPNPSAAQALGDLRRQGVATVILSGDDPRTVHAIAAEVGAEDWAGGLSPEEKSLRIKRWQDSGERVAMAGDGVNDAPALAQADLALAVAEGTDLAGETADVLLTREDLTTVPRFLRLSSRTRRIIRENLSWAFAYNLVAVPLAVAGLISPIIAAAAMAASSILVVGNSLRLRKNASCLPVELTPGKIPMLR
jgi:Cu+-exporting ATPase